MTSDTAGRWTETLAHADHGVLRLHGALSAVPRARAVLAGALADRGAVVDLSALRVGWLRAETVHLGGRAGR